MECVDEGGKGSKKTQENANVFYERPLPKNKDFD